MLRVQPLENSQQTRPAEISGAAADAASDESLAITGTSSLGGLFIITLALTINAIFQIAFVSINFHNSPYGSVPSLSIHILMAAAFLFSYILRVYFASGILMVLREVTGECSIDRNGLIRTYCNPLADKDYLPPENILVLSCLPVVLDCALPSLRWWVIIVCSLISIIFLVATSMVYGRTNSTLFVALGVMLQIFTIFINRYNHSLSNESFRNAIGAHMQRVRDAVAESNAEEWRGMLMNIAHDLKTPMAALTNGSDLLNKTLNKLEKALHYQGGFSKEAASELSSAQSTVCNMKNIGRYMSMMIHRCIDYTKSAHGIQLVPFLETVDLAELLGNVIACVQDMQPNSSLELSPFPMDMSQLINTDKQWLEENILCLLANAVKYGLGGPVSIRVYLEREAHGGSTRGSSSRQSYLSRHSSSSQSHSYSQSRISEPSLQLPTTNGMESMATFGSNRFSSFLRIEVEDNGMGLSEEVRKGIFDEQLCHVQRLSGGTGLGLYTLAQRCSALGGDCGVQDRPDQQRGSLFWLRVPYVPKTRSPRSPPRSPRSHVNVSSGSTSPGGIGAASPYISPVATPVASRTKSTKSIVSVNDALIDLEANVRHEEAQIMQHFNEIREESSSTLLSLSVTKPSEPSCNPNPTLSAEAESLPTVRMARGVSAKSESSQTASMKISPLSFLVVDDSLAILKMTRKLLEKDGHRVEVAQNGLEAVDCWKARSSAKKQPFDAILMDIQMPIMDGIEATKQIRAAEVDAKLSQSDDLLHRSTSIDQLIIGCSANADTTTMNNAFLAGVNAFMPKPIQLGRLKEIVSDFLEKLGE